MGILQGFDTVFLLRSEFLGDFITGLDQKFKELVESALDMALELPPGLEEVIEELLANFFLPVPRLLFATKNIQYPSSLPCPPSREGGAEDLLERLKAHRDLGTFDDGLLEKNRLTFLRPDFFDIDNRVQMTFESGKIRIHLEGKLFLGRRFNRFRARNSSDTFSMDFIYEPVPLPIEQNLVGLASYIITDDKIATPPLPTLGFPVYVKTICLEMDDDGNCKEQKFVLPSAQDFPVETCNEREQCRAQERASQVQLFRVQVGDQIFTSESSTTPRFEVRLQMSANMLLVPVLVDLDNEEKVVAQGVGGRTIMQLIEIENMNLRIDNQLNPFSDEEMDAICRSMVKITPFSPFAQADPSAEALRLLEIFGNIDFTFFLQTFQLSFNPRIEEGEEFVRSDSNRLNFTGIKVLPDPDGLIILAGDLMASSAGNIDALSDFSNSADITLGLSQEFLNKVLIEPLNNRIKKSLECNYKIHDGSVNVTANFTNPTTANPRGSIQIEAKGEGTKPDAVWWVDVDFKFTARFSVGIELQNAIMRKIFFLNEDGAEVSEDDTEGCPIELPIDAYGGGRIHLEVLDMLGITSPEFTIPNPDQNPLCFLGYCDPRKLDPQPVYCTAPATPPPVLDESGNEVSPPPVNPDPSCRSQSDFVGAVTHAKEMSFRFPEPGILIMMI